MQGEPRTRRGRESRDRIVEHAAALIAERGVEHTGLDDVLAGAGVGKSQLYHYFADRDAVIEAAVARRCAQVGEALTALFADLDSLTALDRALEEYVVVYERSLRGCPIGRIAAEVAGRNDGAHREIIGAFAAWERHFAGLFTRLRSSGELRADADPGALATALLAALEGGQLLGQTRQDASALRVAIVAVLGYIRTFLNTG